MTKEYYVPFPDFPHFKVPKLYKVEVTHDLFDEPLEISIWLKENCRDHYYKNRHSVQFESQEDAVMFALRWS